MRFKKSGDPAFPPIMWHQMGVVHGKVASELSEILLAIDKAGEEGFVQARQGDAVTSSSFLDLYESVRALSALRESHLRSAAACESLGQTTAKGRPKAQRHQATNGLMGILMGLPYRSKRRAGRPKDAGSDSDLKVFQAVELARKDLQKTGAAGTTKSALEFLITKKAQAENKSVNRALGEKFNSLKSKYMRGKRAWSKDQNS